MPVLAARRDSGAGRRRNDRLCVSRQAALDRDAHEDGRRRAGALHIMLAASPVTQTETRAWLVSVHEDDAVHSDRELYDFNMEILMQDTPIVESQWPRFCRWRSMRSCISGRIGWRWLTESGWRGWRLDTARCFNGSRALRHILLVLRTISSPEMGFPHWKEGVSIVVETSDVQRSGARHAFDGRFAAKSINFGRSF